MKWFIKRFQEPSTWGGVGLIISGAVYFAAGKKDLESAGMIASGIAAVFLPEKTPEN